MNATETTKCGRSITALGRPVTCSLAQGHAGDHFDEAQRVLWPEPTAASPGWERPTCSAVTQIGGAVDDKAACALVAGHAGWHCSGRYTWPTLVVQEGAR